MTLVPGDTLREVQMVIFYYGIPGKAARSGGHSPRLGISISGFDGAPKGTQGETVFGVPPKLYQPLAKPPPKKTCILGNKQYVVSKSSFKICILAAPSTLPAMSLSYVEILE